ncbi:MAG: hypothetical protein HQL63_10990 [Magnetococcales bacterium]|nr:hypothetical protein [Magnetococcales bacterium]MBF0322856.1 hypothetical protein [Magnetococcales bacterium]
MAGDDDTRTRGGSSGEDASPGEGKDEQAPAKGNKLLLPLIGVGVIAAAAGAYLMLSAKKPELPVPTQAELFEKSRRLIDDRVQDALQAESQSHLLGQSSPLLSSHPAAPESGHSGHARQEATKTTTESGSSAHINPAAAGSTPPAGSVPDAFSSPENAKMEPVAGVHPGVP